MSQIVFYFVQNTSSLSLYMGEVYSGVNCSQPIYSKTKMIKKTW